jgi:hypothetical protein
MRCTSFRLAQGTPAECRLLICVYRARVAESCSLRRARLRVNFQSMVVAVAVDAAARQTQPISRRVLAHEQSHPFLCEDSPCLPNDLYWP